MKWRRVAEGGAAAQDPLQRGVEPGRAGQGRGRAVAHGPDPLAQVVVGLGDQPLRARSLPRCRLRPHPGARGYPAPGFDGRCRAESRGSKKVDSPVVADGWSARDGGGR